NAFGANRNVDLRFLTGHQCRRFAIEFHLQRSFDMHDRRLVRALSKLKRVRLVKADELLALPIKHDHHAGAFSGNAIELSDTQVKLAALAVGLLNPPRGEVEPVSLCFRSYALSSLRQVATAVAVDVQLFSIQDHPDACSRVVSKHKQAVFGQLRL